MLPLLPRCEQRCHTQPPGPLRGSRWLLLMLPLAGIFAFISLSRRPPSSQSSGDGLGLPVSRSPEKSTSTGCSTTLDHSPTLSMPSSSALHAAPTAAQIVSIVCPFDDPMRDAGCHPELYPSSANQMAVSLHTTNRFFLASYGAEDFVSRVSITGDRFFEQPLTDLLLWLLRKEAGSQRGNGARASDGHCVGTRDGDVWFLDVGANIGVRAVAAAAAGFPTVAIEATPPTAERLRCSKHFNRLSHLHIVNSAVHRESGKELCMRAWAGNYGGNAIGDADATCPAEATVHTLRLDDVFRDWKGVAPAGSEPASFKFLPLASGPTVMKMDVEGCEMLALEGYRNLFGSTHRPKYVIIELIAEYLGRFGTRLQTALVFLMDKGYRVFRGDLAVEYTRMQVDEYPSSGDWGHFPGQKDCVGNYFLLRDDVPLPILDRAFDGCRTE